MHHVDRPIGKERNARHPIPVVHDPVEFIPLQPGTRFIPDFTDSVLPRG